MESVFSDLATLVLTQRAVAVLAVFLGGLLSAASPCVLAAIPLIIGYVGGYSEGDTKRAALYSLVFILGLSITFTLLGAAASMLGQVLGFLGDWLSIGFGTVAILMGLHLTGLISLPLPFKKTRNVKSKGLYGALLLGLLTGAISSPCATPVLAVILAYVSTEGDIAYGSLLLFVYALGHCTLIFAAGLSVGIAERLINSHGLMRVSAIAKKASGVLLVIVGLYFGLESVIL
jgi:cytochrome c biogenesis protein CcdA